jgi:hypothetical protein
MDADTGAMMPLEAWTSQRWNDIALDMDVATLE